MPRLHRTFEKIAVALIIVGWIYAGFPYPYFDSERGEIALKHSIQKAYAAPTYFGSASAPADNGDTQEPVTSAVTPPSSMLAGDLVFLIGQSQDSSNMSLSEQGGQSWINFGVNSGNSTNFNVWFATYNGTWSANPSINFAAAAGNNAATAIMHVFRPPSTDRKWIVDQAFTGADFASPGAGGSVTITGQTTGADDTVTLAGWFTNDDNTWNTLTGTGWAVTGGAQYRNIAGTDQSASFAHYLAGTSGTATGNVSKKEATLGGDAGRSFIVTLTAKPEISISGTLYSDEGRTPIASKTINMAVATGSPAPRPFGPPPPMVPGTIRFPM